MNPNASLKSLKTNFLLMASRPATSRQPFSRASAVLRVSPESFSAIAALLRLSAPLDSAPHSAGAKARTALANSPSILTYRTGRRNLRKVPRPKAGLDPGGGHGLVFQHRLGRRNGDPHPCDFPLFSRLDFRRQLRFGRTASGLERAAIHGAAVPLCSAS